VEVGFRKIVTAPSVPIARRLLPYALRRQFDRTPILSPALTAGYASVDQTASLSVAPDPAAHHRAHEACCPCHRKARDGNPSQFKHPFMSSIPTAPLHRALSVAFGQRPSRANSFAKVTASNPSLRKHPLPPPLARRIAAHASDVQALASSRSAVVLPVPRDRASDDRSRFARHAGSPR